MTYEYSISGWVHKDGKLEAVTVKSGAIQAEYDRLGINPPESFTKIVTDGIRYSYQDFDVLSHAMHCLPDNDERLYIRLSNQR